MLGVFFCHNGALKPVDEARFSLDDIELTHGYGCYETLKLRGGLVYFPEFHEERLLRSLAILGIGHALAPGMLVAALEGLARANGLRDANLKALAVARQDRPADWYAIALAPLSPAPEAYEQGVDCLLYHGERQFPQAKSLSLLLSTIAYRAALDRGCHDALLINGRGELTEGTRMNLFYAEGGAAADGRGPLYTPPAKDALEGITRRTLMEALAAGGYPVAERPLREGEALSGRFGLMVSSTSNKALPVRSLLRPDGPPLRLPLPAFFQSVRRLYDEHLSRYADSRGFAGPGVHSAP
jgi:branched-subunit amino acid aminotransferase/4-amino-4-deoxychorismate lyase